MYSNMLLAFRYAFDSEESHNEQLKEAENYITRYGLENLTAEELLKKVKEGDTEEILEQATKNAQSKIINQFIEKYGLTDCINENNIRSILDNKNMSSYMKAMAILSSLNINQTYNKFTQDTDNTNSKTEGKADDVKALYKEYNEKYLDSRE